MFREKCKVLENKKVAPGHFVLKLGSSRIGKHAQAGQFVQVLCADSMDPLLPRPFSFLTVTSKDISILYHVVGKGTHILSQAKKWDSLLILGPLGKGFNTTEVSKKKSSRDKKFVLIGGGVGIPPLYHLAQDLLKKKITRENIHVFLGARHRSLLLCEKEFKKLRIDLKVATDDGSKGSKGFVTEIFEDFLMQNDPDAVKVFTCGPTPMLKAVSLISMKYGVDCEVSVEVPMACGFGACLGCAVKVRTPSQRDTLELKSSMLTCPSGTGSGQGYRFAIACCEGPVFKGDQILWD